MRKLLPLLVLAISVVVWSSPASAKQCENEERNRLRQLEHALAHCRGDADCERAARDKCFRQLSHAGCNVSICASGGLGSGTGEQCAFNTAEGASKAIDTLLTNQVLPALNAEWPTKATTPPPDPTGLDPYTLPSQEATVSGGCSNDGGDVACVAVAGSCSKVVAKFTPTIHGLSALQFQTLAVKSLTTQDLSSFSSAGPDATRIHAYGAFPADGVAWNSASAVVLPVKGLASAITTDLGEIFTLCANTPHSRNSRNSRSTNCGRPAPSPASATASRKTSRWSAMTWCSTVCSASRGRYTGATHPMPLGSAPALPCPCPKIDTPAQACAGP